MKYVKYVILVLTFSPVLLFGEEPSAFGAGDLSSSSPYGLTSNEKVILETKKKLKKVALKSNTQANQLDSLRERIDGLQSIVESLSRKSHNNKINLQKLQEFSSQSFQSINEYQKRQTASIGQNKLEIDKLKLMILEVSKSLDEINKNYVTKDEYNALIKDFNNFKALMAAELKSKNRQTKSKSQSIKSSDLYNRAKNNFNKKRYTQAIRDYEELIRRHYKPAYAHYMIGEMYFKRKDYAKSISYFKKSSSLYSKASYMPKLMLHTAIAMEKTKDKQHADAFFNAIINKYPNSKEALEAEKYLGILQ
ncbi:tetratricopeptide repeat protein [Sulfurimonas sp.]|uniref:tetratricopeptide repeat protein n=1 Tax=Sulfurimonas sp. TaxID=2022749 RepID=UPI002629B532|nr:tetratricopeptide repeat protein [Sulfurimonas sp.]